MPQPIEHASIERLIVDGAGLPQESMSDHVAEDEFASSDLEMLAEQLRQDARFLADRYPARLASELPPIPLTRRIAPAIWSAAVATLLLAAVGLWSLVDSGLLVDRVVSEPHPSTMRRFAGQRHRQSPARREMPRSLPATFFHNLTGPEKEAVLDLFEERNLVQSSLSI